MTLNVMSSAGSGVGSIAKTGDDFVGVVLTWSVGGVGAGVTSVFTCASILGKSIKGIVASSVGRRLNVKVSQIKRSKIIDSP